MKTKIKLLSVCLVLLLVCSFLTGCTWLDSMREHHATWTAMGDTSSITYKGVEYKQIEFSPLPDTMFKSDVKLLFVTEPDVPVLLSESRAVTLDMSEDKNFINGALYDDYTQEYAINMDYNYDYYMEEPNPVLYCKADLYDYVMAELEKGIEYTTYAFEHFSDDNLGERELELYYLTEEEADVINDVAKNNKLDIGYEVSESYGYNYMFRLIEISDDEMFARHAYDVYTNNAGEYYLVDYTYDSGEYYDYLSISDSFKVPPEYKEVFDKFCAMDIPMM